VVSDPSTRLAITLPPVEPDEVTIPDVACCAPPGVAAKIIFPKPLAQEPIELPSSVSFQYLAAAIGLPRPSYIEENTPKSTSVRDG
jgi:hypothetical protein